MTNGIFWDNLQICNTSRSWVIEEKKRVGNRRSHFADPIASERPFSLSARNLTNYTFIDAEWQVNVFEIICRILISSVLGLLTKNASEIVDQFADKGLWKSRFRCRLRIRQNLLTMLTRGTYVSWLNFRWIFPLFSKKINNRSRRDSWSWLWLCFRWICPIFSKKINDKSQTDRLSWHSTHKNCRLYDNFWGNLEWEGRKFGNLLINYRNCSRSILVLFFLRFTNLNIYNSAQVKIIFPMEKTVNLYYIRKTMFYALNQKFPITKT